MSCLITSIRSKHFHQAKLLISVGVDVNTRDTRRRTALMETCFHEERRCVKMVKLLLKNGAEIGLQDDQGMNALHQACKFGREEVVAVLMGEAHTFDPNDSDDEGNTALHHAASSGNIVTLRLLLKTLKRFKLSVDKVNTRGETPLICTAKGGHVLCFRCLVEDGKASRHMRDNIEFRTADEWKEIKSTASLKSSSSLSSRGRFSAGKLTYVKVQEQIHPLPSPQLQNPTSSSTNSKKSYKDNLKPLFQIYEEYISNAFRAGTKPPPVMTSPITWTAWGDGKSALSRGSSPSAIRPRYSVRKTAKLVVETKDLCKRRTHALSGLSKPAEQSGSRALFSSPRLLTRPLVPIKVRPQSVRSVGRVSLNIEKCKKNLAKLSVEITEDNESEKKKSNVGQDVFVSEQSRAKTDEDDFLCDENQCDGDADDDDLMTLSSPAALASLYD